MAASKPIVAMINGEAADIISEAKCGFSAPAGNSEKLRDIILEMYNLSSDELEKKGQNGYQYYKNNFDKEICMKHLHKIIKS